MNDEFVLSPSDVVRVYVALRNSSADEEERVFQILDRMERFLFERLSIEQMELLGSNDPRNVESVLRNL